MFPEFPRLPPELRLSIWKQVLQQNRLIFLAVVVPPDVRDRNDLQRAPSGMDYNVHIITHHRAALLLRASREFRQVALSIYRVPIPKSSRSDERQGAINSEMEFVEVCSEGPTSYLRACFMTSKPLIRRE